MFGVLLCLAATTGLTLESNGMINTRKQKVLKRIFFSISDDYSLSDEIIPRGIADKKTTIGSIFQTPN